MGKIDFDTLVRGDYLGSGSNRDGNTHTAGWNGWSVGIEPIPRTEILEALSANSRFSPSPIWRKGVVVAVRLCAGGTWIQERGDGVDWYLVEQMPISWKGEQGKKKRAKKETAINKYVADRNM